MLMSPNRRETRLLQLVHLLWHELRHPTLPPDQLDIELRTAGMGWAIPGIDHIDPDDWLTPDQIAHELGYSVNTIYVWVRRYKLKQVRGTYRWGDILERTRITRHFTHGE